MSSRLNGTLVMLQETFFSSLELFFKDEPT